MTLVDREALYKVDTKEDSERRVKEIHRCKANFTAVEETIWNQTGNMISYVGGYISGFRYIFYSRKYNGWYGVQLGENGLEYFKAPFLRQETGDKTLLPVSLEEYLKVLKDTQDKIFEEVAESIPYSILTEDELEMIKHIFELVQKYPKHARVGLYRDHEREDLEEDDDAIIWTPVFFVIGEMGEARIMIRDDGISYHMVDIDGEEYSPEEARTYIRNVYAALKGLY